MVAGGRQDVPKDDWMVARARTGCEFVAEQVTGATEEQRVATSVHDVHQRGIVQLTIRPTTYP